MADVLPLKLMDLGAGLGQLREFQAGDSLNKALSGLGNVDNTSDANKPVSTAQATALAEKVAKSDVVGTFNTVTGTANALVLTVTPMGAATATLRAGTQVRFRASAANTGAATINWGGTGVKSCVTVTGVALPAGYIRTDVDTVATYDGTYFVLQREVETGSNSNGYYVRWATGTLLCYYVGATPSALTYISVAGLFRNLDRTLTFPATFTSVPTVLPSTGAADGIVWLVVNGIPTTSSFRCISVSVTNDASAQDSYIATGSWY